MKRMNRTLLALAVLLVGLATRGTASAAETNAVPPTNTLQTASAPSSNAFKPVDSTDWGRFGLGLIVGEPTGLSLKYWLSEKNAVDLGAAWSFGDSSSFQLHSDFLTHKFDLFPVNSGELPLYFGVGGRVKIPDRGETRVGVRVPVGISYLFADIPVEVFAEVAPVVDFTPSTQLRFNGGVGVRYYFK